MLDTQNQGPQCMACGSPMKLTAIEPSNSSGQDLRTFACPHCRRVQQHIIESTVAGSVARAATFTCLGIEMKRFVQNENIVQYRKLIAIAESDPSRDEV